MALAFIELVLQWFGGPDTLPSPSLGLFGETNFEPFAVALALLHSLRYGRGRDLEEDLAH